MGIIGDIFGLARETVSLTVDTAKFGLNTVRDAVGVQEEKEQPVKKVVKKRKPSRAKKSTTTKKAVADK